VEPIRTVDFPTPAARPANSVLGCDRIAKAFDPPRRPWRVALEEVMTELLDQEWVREQA
jgi:dTDP-4-dehydrorhamnose reductase